MGFFFQSNFVQIGIKSYKMRTQIQFTVLSNGRLHSATLQETHN